MYIDGRTTRALARIAIALELVMNVGCADPVATVADRNAPSVAVERGEPTPYRIEIVSGDGQRGAAGQLLPDRLEIRLTDQADRPVNDWPVSVSVARNGGSIVFGRTTPIASELAAMLADARAVPVGRTDRDGVLSVGWILGAEPGAKAVEMQVLTRGGSAAMAALRVQFGAFGD